MHSIRKIIRRHTTAALVGAALLLTLSACGGGGSSAPVAPPTPVPTVPAASNYLAPVTSVAPANYAAKEDASVVAGINPVRLGAGAGLVAQSAALDSAARQHASFLVSNQLVNNAAYLDGLHEGVLGGHYEDPALAGFTGKFAQSRATAAGYGGTVAELALFGAANGAECVASFENSVYHLGQMLSSFVDMGLSFNAGNGGGSACVIVLGVPSATSGQLPTDGGVAAYPYAGQTGVLPTFYNQGEAPTPVADLAVAGHPVLVSLYTQAVPSLLASEVVIQSFALSTPDGKLVSTRVLVKPGVGGSGVTLTSDNNIVGAGTVFLVPTVPLVANTLYRVNFAATVKGRAVSRDWSFMTGAAN